MKATLESIDQNILKWLGYIERIRVLKRLSKILYIVEVDWARGRDRTMRRWAEGVKEFAEQTKLGS